MKYPGSPRGFSLIEILLSLGIISFAFVGIIGLISSGLGSVKASSDDTLIATMADQLVDELHSRYFVDNTPVATSATPPATRSRHAVGDANVLPGTADVSSGAPAAAAPSPMFFDATGMRLTYASGSGAGRDMARADALAAGAVYQCAETLQGDPYTLSTTGSDGTAGVHAVNLVNITLAFSWPAQAANPANHRLLHATMARH